MAKSQILDWNAAERRKVIRHEEDGKTWVETRQDVEGLIRYAKILRENEKQKDDSALGVRVAFIPKSELDRSFNEGWFHDENAWRRWANDPANACYRTTEGTI